MKFSRLAVTSQEGLPLARDSWLMGAMAGGMMARRQSISAATRR